MFVNSCDTPPPSSDTASEPLSTTNQFFSFAPDSVGPALAMARDTLRRQNKANPFAKNFVADHGVPVWNDYNVFPQQGHIVMLVPVVRASSKKVTGLIDIMLARNRPIFRWIPRGSELAGADQPDKKTLENVMLIFEQQIFGRVHLPGTKVKVTEKTGPLAGGSKAGATDIRLQTYTPITIKYNCGYVSGDDGESWAFKGCLTETVWIWVPEGGGGGNWPPADGGSGDEGSGGCPTCSGGGDPGSGDDGSDDLPEAGEAVAIQLRNLLEQNEFALLDIPCDQIPNWQALAQFTPPQSVINKIANLDDNYTSIITGDWNIQYIQDAEGAVVNMDYFPVTVNQLPNNPGTGQPFTADGFLNYMRTNLDDFFDGNFTQFGPYNSTENQIWQSNNYLGAIMRFEISPEIAGVTFSQDGSVISSDQNEKSWNFTTIESPADWNHPVSGTRKFGYTQNGDGSYTFYTRGVDRIAESFDEFIGNYTPAPSAFEGADALWNTFKDDVYGFVESHGGNAQQPDNSDNSIWRPNWDEVSDIVMGTGSRTVSDLGCK